MPRDLPMGLSEFPLRRLPRSAGGSASTGSTCSRSSSEAWGRRRLQLAPAIESPFFGGLGIPFRPVVVEIEGSSSRS